MLLFDFPSNVQCMPSLEDTAVCIQVHASLGTAKSSKTFSYVLNSNTHVLFPDFAQILQANARLFYERQENMFFCVFEYNHLSKEINFALILDLCRIKQR